MKSSRLFILFLFLGIFLVPWFTAKAVLAEEESSKEPMVGLLETKEVEPAGYDKKTDRLILIANCEIVPTLSYLSGSGSLWGGSINGLVAPAYKLNNRNFLILMYDGQYHKKWDFYSHEEGPTERTEFQRHTLTPMFRTDFGTGRRYSITPSFFYTVTYNKDIEGGWSKGLYNYKDAGAGVDFDMRGLGFGKGEGALELGAQYYHRRYPNYKSLLDYVNVDDEVITEEDEKDYSGIIASAGYEWVKTAGFSWRVDYSMLYKTLDDKKVVDSSGVLSSEKQHDYLHDFRVKLSYLLDPDGRLEAGLNLNARVKRSNQNYYDGRGTTYLGDDVSTSNYYDYNSWLIKPYMAYTSALFPLRTSLSYGYRKMDYTDRKAKFRNGDYRDEKHYETEQEIDLTFRYDLAENWGLLAQLQRIVARSNNDDEGVYQYDYEITNYSIGLSYEY